MSENDSTANGVNGNGNGDNAGVNDNPPETKISPFNFGVVLLGIYLIAVLLLSVYLLGISIMAEPPEKTVGTLRKNCCGDDNSICPPINPANSQTNTTTAGTANSANTEQSNTVTNANSAANNNSANANAANTANANRPAVNAAANRTATTANTATNANGANTTASIKQETPEIQIPPYVCVEHFNRLTADGFLFLVVLFAGMLGASVRGVFSFVRHLGVGDFSFNWLWFYLLLPFSGAPVSLFLYFLIRGGFYGSPINKGLVLNLAAFAALGCLSGLFSENAMEKLRQVAEVLMTKVPRKSNKPNNPPGS